MPLLRLQDSEEGSAAHRQARKGPIDRDSVHSAASYRCSRKALYRFLNDSPKTKDLEQPSPQLRDKHRLLSELARRRGFFWGSFEIYGGVSGFIDLGPLGTGLKREIEDTWRAFFLGRHGFVEISTPIITPERVLEASGHVQNFKDPMTECTNCHRRFRADQLIKDSTGTETEGLDLNQLSVLLKQVKCPECGGILGSPQYFVTMFKTNIGPYGEEPAYTRPEAAQGIFVDFHRVLEVMREKFPLGIAQVGTVLRNEISPRQGPIRLREFTIMDFEIFFDPEKPECPYLDEVNDDRLFIITEDTRKNGKSETTIVTTAEALEKRLVKSYDSPVEKTVRTVRPNHEKIRKRFGSDAGRIISLLAKEDLPRILQGKKSGDSIRIEAHDIPIELFDTKDETIKEAGTRFLPHVIEPSFGVERLVYSTLEHNLRMKEERLILSLPFGIAPTQAAVYPLVNKDGLVEKAQSVHRSLRESGLRVEYDDSGSIGRRYARADEAGIPLGITVDYDTLKDDTVTLRDRDSWNQIRVKIKGLKPTIDSIVNTGFPSNTG